MSTEYTCYIITHKSYVRKAAEKLKELGVVDHDIDVQSHDLSKWNDCEYKPYDSYFYGTVTPEVKEAFDYAWLHHIHNNPHHWQYWVLTTDEEGVKILDMPDNYLEEMICDWWSFSLKSGNPMEIFNWYESKKDNMMLSQNTRARVEEILGKLKAALEAEDVH